jgi:amino acid permease
MKKFIKNMQTKSESDKRIFAFWTASMITLFIFGIWLLNFISVFGNPDNSDIVVQNQANPISALFGEIKNTFDVPKGASKKVYPAQ